MVFSNAHFHETENKVFYELRPSLLLSYHIKYITIYHSTFKIDDHTSANSQKTIQV